MLSPYTNGYVPFHTGLELIFAGPGFAHELADTYAQLQAHPLPFPGLKCWIGADTDASKNGLWICVEAVDFWLATTTRYVQLTDGNGRLIGLGQSQNTPQKGDPGPQGDPGPAGPQGISWVVLPGVVQPPATATAPYFLAFLPQDSFGVWSWNISLQTWERLGSLKGSKGDRGPIGPQGKDGNQGNQGPAGEQGTPGDTGGIGPIGPQGPVGFGLMPLREYGTLNDPGQIAAINLADEYTEYVCIGDVAGAGRGNVFARTPNSNNWTYKYNLLVGSTNTTAIRQKLNKEWFLASDIGHYDLHAQAWDIVAVDVFQGDAPGSPAVPKGAGSTGTHTYSLGDNKMSVTVTAVGGGVRGVYIYYYPVDGAGGYLGGSEVTPPPPQPAVITLGALPDHYPGDAPFALSASSTNTGTPLVLTSGNVNAATIAFSNNQWLVTPVAAGSYSILANQAAGNGYAAGSASVNGQVVARPATVFYGAFANATPAAADFLAATTAQWDKGPQVLTISCTDQHPGWWEPKSQGIRHLLQNASGADNTSSFVPYSLTINGVDGWAYVHENGQYNTAFVERLSAPF